MTKKKKGFELAVTGSGYLNRFSWIIFLTELRAAQDILAENTSRVFFHGVYIKIIWEKMNFLLLLINFFTPCP